jgi:hypothetical protein
LQALERVVQGLDQGEAAAKAAIQGRSKRRDQIERSDYAYLSSDQREGQSWRVDQGQSKKLIDSEDSQGSRVIIQWRSLEGYRLGSTGSWSKKWAGPRDWNRGAALIQLLSKEAMDNGVQDRVCSKQYMDWSNPTSIFKGADINGMAGSSLSTAPSHWSTGIRMGRAICTP